MRINRSHEELSACHNGLAESSAKAGHLFPGIEPVTARQVANAYVRSIEGPDTGRIYQLF